MLHLLLTSLSLIAAPDTGKHIFVVGDAGLVSSSGNSEFTSFSAGDKITVVHHSWKFTQTFGVTYARAADSTTTELWQGSLRGDAVATSRWTLYFLTDFGRNTFAGVRYRIAPSFGASMVAFRGPSDTLKIEAGGGYAYQAAVAPDTDRSYPAGRAALIYHHKLGPHAAFDEIFEYLPNFRVSADYRINSGTSITAPITAGIALRAAYLIRYEGLPETGFKKTDRVLTTGVQVTF